MSNVRNRPAKQPGPPPAVPGVYVILLGKSAYIGGSLRCHARLIDHLHDLGHGQHENAALQRTFATQGNRFTFAVKLLPRATPGDLAHAEQRLIDHHRRLGRRIINESRPCVADYLGGRGKRRGALRESPATSPPTDAAATAPAA